MTTFAIHSSCRRQLLPQETKDAHLSHFDGSEEVLLELIEAGFDKKVELYRPGVVSVPVPTTGFFSSIVEITMANRGTICANFDARREGETPYLSHTYFGAQKAAAQRVDLILYRKDVLAETNENTVIAGQMADWELASINASPTEDATPMHPVTMARNFLEEAGGTKGDFSAEDFAKSISFWSTHAQLKG